jgi:DNA invertase Pin-like site-specific DNA recombinase
VILDYAHRHRLTIDEFVEIEVSSRKNLRQRGISQLLEQLDPKDVLLVSELSRLGRSVSQIILLVDRMIEKQLRFVAVKEGIDLEGVQDIQTKVTVTMFGLFAEIERDLISERTKEGLAAARAKGKIIGRAKIMDVSRTTLRHFIKTRKLN